MRFDVAAVDGKLVGNGAGGRHLLEDALPDATLRPAIVPVVDRCRRPIDGRNVAPSTACLQDMQDARDDRAVVNARLARPAARQVRAKRLPGLIRQPEQALRHDDRPPATQIRRKYTIKINKTVWVPYLVRNYVAGSGSALTVAGAPSRGSHVIRRL